MDPVEQNLARFRQPATAVAGGVAAALVIATLPHVYLENMVGATGLSDFIPAAAPPLGNTARSLVAVAAGMISASAIYVFLNHKPKFLGGGSDMGLAIRKNLSTESMDRGQEGKSRFSVSKLNLSAKSLTKFLKKPKKSAGQVSELSDLPDTRPADRHPDAPVRQPIFASSDLGTPLVDKIQPFDRLDAEQNIPDPGVKSDPAIVECDQSIAETSRLSQTEEKQESGQPENIELHEPRAATREDLSALSLAELADRLHSGLRRLEALERREPTREPVTGPESAAKADNTERLDEVVETPASVTIPPLRSVESNEGGVQDNRQADMDAALKAALGTLERMTVHR